MIDIQGVIASLTTAETNDKIRQILQYLADQVTAQRNKIGELEAVEVPDVRLTYTPIQITANQNDYAQPETPGRWRLSSDASRDITGIAYSNDGEPIYIVNVGSNDIVLKHQDAASRAENRIISTSGADITLGSNEIASGWYDEVSLRWRMCKCEGGGGAGGSITVDEVGGIPSFGSITTLSFDPADGFTVTNPVAGTAQINLTGGGGAAWTEVEVDLGSSPSWRGSFVVVDGTVAGTSKIGIVQATGPYTGKGTLADEAEMDPIHCIATPGTGQFTVRWQTMPQYAPFTYAQSGNGGGGKDSIAAPSGRRSEHDIVGTRRIGKVKGNVKFLYMVT